MSRILIAEDDITNQKVVGYLIQSLGFQYDMVSTGLEALDALKQTTYDLILLDLRMPDMDGFQTARTIRKSGNKVPIIAVTACALNDDERLCLEAGMDGYLPKPFDKHKFDSIILQWLDKEPSAVG